LYSRDLNLGLFGNVWNNESRAGFGSYVKQQFRDLSGNRSCPTDAPPHLEMDSAPCTSTLTYPEALQEQQKTISWIRISICASHSSLYFCNWGN
jgi:hypothetical protein